jgi:Tfp pilus assembly protein PilF
VSTESRFIGGTHSFAVILTVIVGLLSACGSPAGKQSDAQQATDALNAGLKAQGQLQTQQALDDYQRCLAHDPRNKYCHYDRGVIEQGQGSTAPAEQDYRAALATDPNFEPALFNLAILRTVPAPIEAEDLYRHVISLEPTAAVAHLNLGFLLKTMDRGNEATAELQRAVQLDQNLASRVPANVTAVSNSPSHK